MNIIYVHMRACIHTVKWRIVSTGLQPDIYSTHMHKVIDTNLRWRICIHAGYLNSTPTVCCGHKRAKMVLLKIRVGIYIHVYIHTHAHIHEYCASFPL